MLDIKFVRDNPEAVKENIRKKFQNAKLPLVDEVIALDAEGQRRPTGPVGGDGGPPDPADHQNHDGDPADD